MGDRTAIAWTNSTWNPVSGCTKVSEGCRNCYGATMAHRFKGRPGWERGFEVTCHPDRLSIPLHWRKGRRVFVCSTGDLFHEAVPDDFIDQVFGIMALTPQHTFQVLTKRADRLLEYCSLRLRAMAIETNLNMTRAVADRVSITWPLPNVWVGATIENQEMADRRIPLLLQVPAALHFVSIEPMLGPVDLSRYLDPLGHLDPTYRDLIRQGMFNSDQVDSLRRPRLRWVICGGETGPKARPMHLAWARGLRDQCAAAGVPFFLKQWGEWFPLGQQAADGLWAGAAGPYDRKRGRADVAWCDEIGTQRSQSVAHQWLRSGQESDSMPDSMFRIGKAAAGHLLDGRDYREFPEAFHDRS